MFRLRHRKAEEEDAERLSRAFARNLPKDISYEPIGQAMALDEQRKQEVEDEKHIWDEFSALENPANLWVFILVTQRSLIQPQRTKYRS